ncbi:hypothetical protein [Luteolibacter sp. Populi]|uniref:hypothetical protein n=1 Tax=Luteolibacter sp. Populi TaxID=3230487 RepID=UPI0034670775
MRWIGILAGAGALSHCAPGGGGKESYSGILPGIQAPGSITYLGQTYAPGYSAVNTNGVLVEYFPEGEGPKKWQRMLALSYLEGTTTPNQQVRNRKTAVEGKDLNAISYSSEITGNHGIDYMLPKGSDLEFSIFRYAAASGGQGVKSLQYAAIIPQETVDAGLPALRAVANKHRTAVLAMPFPEVGRRQAAQ